MLHSTLCITAICIDLSFSFVFTIFYGSDARSSSLNLDHFVGLWSFYSIFTSATDLVLLAGLRSLALLFILRNFSATGKYSWLFWSICLFSYIFTLTKILCLAEDIDFLNRPGVILSLVWSLGATAVLGYLIYTLPAIPSKYSNLLKLDKTTSKNDEAKQEETKREEELTTYDHIHVLLGYCKCEWKWLTAGFSAMLVFVVAEIFEPSATGYVLGSVIDKKGYHALIMAVLFRIGITFIAIIFGGFAEGCMEYSTSLIARKLRLDLFTSLVFKDIAFFDITNSGEMVSRLTADCQTVSTAVSSNLTQFIRSSVLIIGSLSFLLFYSWRMTLVTFITFPLMIILTKIYGSFYDRLSESTQSTMAKANQIAAEVLSTMRTVRSFACEKREISRFSNMLNSVLKYDRKRSLAASGYIWSCDIAESLTVAVILLYGGHLVFSDKMSSGILVTYILYLEQLENNLY
ncbi:ABC transporter transmembrane region, partial [Ancylostoma duodenale]